MKALLVNPPVYDLRLDWSRWHQPLGLLQVGMYLTDEGHDVRLIDCLRPVRGDKIQRAKYDMPVVNDTSFQRWHYGWNWQQLERKVEQLKEEDWIPNKIYVTSLMTFWWEGVRDTVAHLRSWFPETPIIVGGVYPHYEPEHAKKIFRGFGKVKIDNELGERVKGTATKLDLYGNAPYFAGLLLYRSPLANQIANEIQEKAESGVHEFAFFDDDLTNKSSKHFENVLDLVIERKLKIKFVMLGNISPDALSGKLIEKMRQAGYYQIYLHDDLALSKDANRGLGAYQKAVERLFKYGGYRTHSPDITAMALVGVPGEKLEQVTERIVHLSHIVGSVNLVAFQPTRGTALYKQHEKYLAQFPLELQNAKFFPFSKMNGYTFTDYQELIRLGALLNSKFHGTTFDFLADSNIAEMVRKSVAEETWRPRLKETIPLVSK